MIALWELPIKPGCWSTSVSWARPTNFRTDYKAHHGVAWEFKAKKAPFLERCDVRRGWEGWWVGRVSIKVVQGED